MNNEYNVQASLPKKRIKQIVELRHILKRQKGEFAGATTLTENDKKPRN